MMKPCLFIVCTLISLIMMLLLMGQNEDMWTKVRKIASLRNIFITIVSLGAFSFFYMFLEWQTTINHPWKPRNGEVFVPAPPCKTSRVVNQMEGKWKDNSLTRQKALVFLRQARTQIGRDIITALESARFKFHTQTGDIRNLPVLIDESKGRYAVIVFEDIFLYFGLHQWNREMVDKYCRDFHVGMIYFLLHPEKRNGADRIDGSYFHQLDTFPLKYATDFQIKDYHLNASTPMLRITRPGSVVKEIIPAQNDWTIFDLDHATYHPVSSVTIESDDEANDTAQRKRKKRKARKPRHDRGTNVLDSDDWINKRVEENGRFATVVQDLGTFDGVQRVIFGGNLKFWLHKVLLLDALSYLSNGKLSLPLERNIQIDIDDMFVGITDQRMISDDVMALLEFQSSLRETIPGFTYQLGFSGKFIFSGNKEETEADRLLLKLHDQFLWFPHMWSHMQAHWFNNVTELCSYMDINRRFSLRHHLNMSEGYAVAPHHGGVFPVHDQLYQCWHDIWNITATSTEEYPHLRPDHKRRGFIHDGIMVLPRQTCGLFTHTMELHKYPGGPEVLHTLIEGGSLFTSFLYNRFNIFMTHLSNYGNDRLGIYTFDRAIKFVQCWTNLRLVYEPPQTVALKYFHLYPEEKTPLWLNPCLDKRHLEVWSKDKSCDRLPDFVVVGPQKTGTTALYWFLNMHPNVESNRQSEKTFEEVQFFSGSNYLKGIDWYMDYFPLPSEETILFEKSATYFDQDVVPRRLAALLPNQKIVAVLIDPAKRAYSWYQHMRSHEDAAAIAHSFYDVVHARRKGTSPALISLQRRCLDPGFYADILEKWLSYFLAGQIVIVDGNLLKDQPAQAMDQLQKDLEFDYYFDYEKVLKFDSKKGFFCQLLPSGRTKCLGKSKGRIYPEMDEKSSQFLDKYYQEANNKLLRLLKSMNKQIPLWLSEKIGS